MVGEADDGSHKNTSDALGVTKLDAASCVCAVVSSFPSDEAVAGTGDLDTLPEGSGTYSKGSVVEDDVESMLVRLSYCLRCRTCPLKMPSAAVVAANTSKRLDTNGTMVA